MPAPWAPGRLGDMTAQPIWVTEHYWPGVAEELVLAQAQRLARVGEWWATVVLPGQQTAFGLFLSSGPEELRSALAQVAVPSTHITAGLVLSARPLGQDPE
jgi:hypothetical protein